MRGEGHTEVAPSSRDGQARRLARVALGVFEDDHLYKRARRVSPTRHRGIKRRHHVRISLILAVCTISTALGTQGFRGIGDKDAYFMRVNP